MSSVRVDYSALVLLSNNALRATADQFATYLLEELRDRAPVSTGELRSSISVDVGTVSQGELPLTIKVGAQHASYVIKGTTGPYRAVPPFGPGSRLGGWARRTGLPPGAVAHVIARKGTDAQHEWISAAVDRAARRAGFR